MIKAVIFDMDGTIIDSEPIYERVNEEIYEKYGFNLSQEDYDRHMGANLKDIWTDILDRYQVKDCLLYTSPSPRDRQKSRMPSSA